MIKQNGSRLYICNQEQERNDSVSCMKNGGECYRTSKKEYSTKYPQCNTCFYQDALEKCICLKCKLDSIGEPENWKNEDPEGEWK